MNGVTDYDVLDLAGQEENLDRLCDINDRISKMEKEVKRLKKVKEPLEKDIKSMLENAEIAMELEALVREQRIAIENFAEENRE